MRRFLPLLWLSCFIRLQIYGGALDEWEKALEWRSFEGIAYGNGRFAAFGFGPSKYASYTLTYTSEDGRNWTRQLHTTIGGRSIAFGNGVFAMTATAAGGATVLSSTDGVAWVRRGGRQSFLGVQFVNGQFIIGGDHPVSSVDAASWATFPTDTWFDQLAFGNGVYAGVGRGGSILSSANGNNWIERIPGETEPFVEYFGTVAFGNGVFLAANNEGLFRSTNAVDWIEIPPKPFFSYSRFSFEGGRFYARTFGEWFTSLNGDDWAALDTRQGGVNSLASDGTNTLLVGTIVLSTSDGSNSVQLVERETIPLGVYDVAEGIAAIGNSYPDLVTYLSKDGVVWTRHSTNIEERIQAVAQIAGDLYAFPTYQPGMYVSSDAVNWKHHTTEPPLVFQAMVRAENGQWVGLGTTNALGTGDAEIVVSNDGVHWTSRLATPRYAPNRLVRGNGLYLAVHARDSPPAFTVDRYYTSRDGVEWLTHTNENSSWFVDVTFGKGVFASISALDSSIRTSLDGVHWTTRLRVGVGLNVSPGEVESIRFHDGTFLAAGTRVDTSGYVTNTVLSSGDGINWTTNRAPANSWTHESFFAQGRHYLLDGETIYRQAAVPLRFAGITSGTDGTVKLGGYADPKTRLRLLSSTNLLNWELDLLLTNESSSFSVPAAIRGDARFFRLGK